LFGSCIIHILNTGYHHGLPHLSGIIAEIFLQSLEDTHLKLLHERSITFYKRYVDDIFLIYNTNKTPPEKTHNYMNRLYPNLKFTPTPEQNNNINFLDLLIT
jgi:hypothetical protein